MLIFTFSCIDEFHMNRAAVGLVAIHFSVQHRCYELTEYQRDATSFVLPELA